MDGNISLKETEHKVFAAAVDDGLWDVLIASFILVFAIAPLLSRRLGDFWSSFVFLPFWALGYGAVRLIRKHVVNPRIGVVRFGQFRKMKLSRAAAILVVVNVVGLLLGILVGQFSDRPGWVFLTPFALLMLTIFSVAGYYLGFPRLYVYGLLTALSPLVGEWLWVHRGAVHHGFPITFGTTAGIMVSIGLIKFALLLRNHPLRTSDPSSSVER